MTGTAASYIATALLAAAATLIILGALVMRPRFHDLMTERDQWKTQAIEAWGRVGDAEDELRILGVWAGPPADEIPRMVRVPEKDAAAAGIIDVPEEGSREGE